MEIGSTVYWEMIDKDSGEVILHCDVKKCELFDICNCKTAACRVMPPDDSCYWYRYFKQLIKDREEEI